MGCERFRSDSSRQQRAVILIRQYRPRLLATAEDAREKIPQLVNLHLCHDDGQLTIAGYILRYPFSRDILVFVEWVQNYGRSFGHDWERSIEAVQEVLQNFLELLVHVGLHDRRHLCAVLLDFGHKLLVELPLHRLWQLTDGE